MSTVTHVDSRHVDSPLPVAALGALNLEMAIKRRFGYRPLEGRPSQRGRIEPLPTPREEMQPPFTKLHQSVDAPTAALSRQV